MLALALSIAGAGTAPAEGEGSVIAHMADGSSLPLRGWSLSYEYSAPRPGQGPVAAPSRVEAAELWVGKRRLPVRGATLLLKHVPSPRERAEGDETVVVDVPVVSEIVLAPPGGKSQTLRAEPPHRDLLAPGADGSAVVSARSLDLVGDTLTGTRRSLCLVTYSVLVECGEDPADRVVRLEFTP